MYVLIATGGSEDDCLDCTPDELASLVREIQDSELVRTHNYHMRGYKNSFIARDLITWFVEKKGLACEFSVCVCVCVCLCVCVCV